MKIKSLLFLVSFLATAMLANPEKNNADSSPPQNGVDWPSFRGINASGIAEGVSTPTTWDVVQSKNVKWKIEVPGLAHASPVIWGDRIFATTAISGKENAELKVGLYGNIDAVDDPSVHQWKVYCFDKNNGKVLWEKTSHKGVPIIKRHTKATHANSTPATNGKYVIALFGSEGLFCYDMDGNQRWKVDLGVLDAGFFRVPEAQWEFGSSPIIYENMVIVQCDIQKNSFIAAFDIETGEQIWRTSRDEVPTWSTPAIYSNEQQTQVIVNGFKHIGSYDAKTGKELWRMSGGGDIPVPTPVLGNGLVYITNAHGSMSPMYAVRLTANGDISLKSKETTNDYISWSYAKGGAYMQTPLVYGEYLYSCRDNGVLTCYNAQTGEKLYQERLSGGRTGFTASPVAADGKIYFSSEVGDIFVIQAGPEFKQLAENPMGEICMATPAISEGVLYFRARYSLVAISEN